jgi:hypothetical protein
MASCCLVEVAACTSCCLCVHAAHVPMAQSSVTVMACSLVRVAALHPCTASREASQHLSRLPMKHAAPANQCMHSPAASGNTAQSDRPLQEMAGKQSQRTLYAARPASTAQTPAPSATKHPTNSHQPPRPSEPLAASQKDPQALNTDNKATAATVWPCFRWAHPASICNTNGRGGQQAMIL